MNMSADNEDREAKQQEAASAAPQGVAAESPQGDAQAALFDGMARSRPPRRRAALEHADRLGLACEQVAEAEVFLEELIQQRPQLQYAPGKHRCTSFPDCDHAGCNVVKQLQEVARRILDRWRSERRSPVRALKDLAQADRDLDRTLAELERSRSAGRRAS